MIYTEKGLKGIKEITDELWELIPDNFNYKNVDRQTLCVWLKSRLETSIKQAEQEILNNVVLEIENCNNFRQAKVDGKDDWNDALQQSACKVDALISVFKNKLLSNN